MPIYEYQCSKCENRFEELVNSTEDEVEVTCTSCDSTKVFRVVSTFSAHCGGSSDARGHSCPAGKGLGTGGFS
ncbi:MAG: zinc ribbon domain-containing protein [Deltaproteobacteria bacterium]|nr:zinc ribbon domain-containing protein [Deltaproteobacteria bacterium]